MSTPAKLSTASRELFRQNLLAQLGAAAPYALPTATLRINAIGGGFDQVSEGDVLAELGYLSDKGLARASSKLVSPEVKRWEITAAGRDYLAENQLG